MSDSVSSEKSQFRQHCRALRKSLGAEARARASTLICERILRWDVFRQSQTILTYMPIKFEADLTPLLAGGPQKRWILPRIIPEEDHRMVFHLYDPDHLIRHPFGMAEPAPHTPTVTPEEIQLALVPGLAFDRHGWRLGYGGGYFDRFLRNFNGVSAGVTFHALLLDDVPHTPLDVPMQWIITEWEQFSIQALAD